MNRPKLVVNIVLAAVLPSAFAQGGPPTGFITKLGQDMDVRSGARILSDDNVVGNLILPELAGGVGGSPVVPQVQLRGGNVQVNDPAQTLIQIFPGFRPFVRATRSEVSSAAFGQNIVVTYNNSTGIHVSPNPGGPGLIVDRVMISGYSTSNDGGKTFTSAYMPPSVPGGETDGDPSIAADRHGNFYFANLAADATHGTIQ